MNHVITEFLYKDDPIVEQLETRQIVDDGMLILNVIIDGIVVNGEIGDDLAFKDSLDGLYIADFVIMQL